MTTDASPSSTRSVSSDSTCPSSALDDDSYFLVEPRVKRRKVTPTSASATDAATKIYTFSLGDSPVLLQLLSSNTLHDLVKIGLEECQPATADGGSADDHLWNLKIAGRKYESERHARVTTLQEVSLQANSNLRLEYDYGSTSMHTFRVVSVENYDHQHDSNQSAHFPRRKPEQLVPPTALAFRTDQVHLDAAFPYLNRWAFPTSSNQGMELNLFQAGRKLSHQGFLQKGGSMMYLPDRPKSLHHYLACLEAGSQCRRGYGTWHSIVVLPQHSKKIQTYAVGLEAGVCDCPILAEPPRQAESLETVFPNVAALAGYRKAKNIQRGWIRYRNSILMIVVGDGSPMTCGEAPKGTAFVGQGCHVPGPADQILFRVQIDFPSLHEMFCVVEGLLGTL